MLKIVRPMVACTLALAACTSSGAAEVLVTFEGYGVLARLYDTTIGVPGFEGSAFRGSLVLDVANAEWTYSDPLSARAQSNSGCYYFVDDGCYYDFGAGAPIITRWEVSSMIGVFAEDLSLASRTSQTSRSVDPASSTSSGLIAAYQNVWESYSDGRYFATENALHLSFSSIATPLFADPHVLDAPINLGDGVLVQAYVSTTRQSCLHGVCENSGYRQVFEVTSIVFTPLPVPEPASSSMFGVGALFTAAVAVRRRRAVRRQD